jgi:hypothetical protein
MNRLNTIREVVAKLGRYPAVAYRLLPHDGGIEIDAPNPGGFPVALINDDPDWTVHAGDYGAHWHLSSPEDAKDLVGFCLSEDCRLKVEQRTFQIRSTLEKRDETGWRMALRRGLFVVRLGRPWSTTFFQNKLVPSRMHSEAT